MDSDALASEARERREGRRSSGFLTQARKSRIILTEGSIDKELLKFSDAIDHTDLQMMTKAIEEGKQEVVSMISKARIGISQEKIGEFCRHHHIQKLSLFGSVLREDYRPDSDVDVLVEFEPNHGPGFIV